MNETFYNPRASFWFNKRIATAWWNYKETQEKWHEALGITRYREFSFSELLRASEIPAEFNRELEPPLLREVACINYLSHSAHERKTLFDWEAQERKKFNEKLDSQVAGLLIPHYYTCDFPDSVAKRIICKYTI